MPATYEPIATTTLSSAAKSITFSSIPNTYTDLVIILNGRTSDADSMTFQLNGDTGNNYSTTQIIGDGSTASSYRSTNTNKFRNFTMAWNLQPALAQIHIFNYAGGTNKTVLVQESVDKNGSGYVGSYVGLWRNTSAVTSIRLSTAVEVYDFVAGTTATLYGIKNA